MLDEYWTRRFGNAPPIAHALRDSFRDCWVRFHSLPESKRYAESDPEWTTLLERHNTVVESLTSDGSKLNLLTTNWSDASSPQLPHERFCELQLPAEYWRTVAMHELDGAPTPTIGTYSDPQSPGHTTHWTT